MPANDNNRPRRGRPLGSGVIDDQDALQKLAAYLVENPKAKRAATIRQVCGLPKADDTVLHRLNRKWREQRERLLSQAKTVQANDVPELIREVVAGLGSTSLRNLAAREAAILRALNIPRLVPHIPRAVPPDISLALGAVGAFGNSSAFKAIAALPKSPAFEAIRMMHAATRALDNSWMGAIHKAAQLQRMKLGSCSK